MKNYFLIRIIFLVLILALTGSSNPTIAKESQTLNLQLPPYSQIEIPGVEIKGDSLTGIFQLKISSEIQFPLTLRARGPFGETVVRKIHSLEELKGLKLETKVVLDSNPDPVSLENFPQLCPRVKISEAPKQKKITIPMARLLPEVREEQKPSWKFIYEGNQDKLNHLPFVQLMDPDAGVGKQPLAYALMDGKNVLMIQKVVVKNDYEDARIVESRKIDPLTGEEKVVMEGTGGFYANFHYAVFPYSEDIKSLDSQLLLHLAEGSLKEINREDLRPEMRTHSFLPGPFLSSRRLLYDMCEWGDTAHQAPVQTLEYRDMAIWDWDYPITKNSDRLLMVVWEGDHEKLHPLKEYLEPHQLLDDLIAVFEIRRDQTLTPLTLKNANGDFEITLVSGNMEAQRHSPSGN